MKKPVITNKITPCCKLPFNVMYWWVSNLNLNTEADRDFILSRINQAGDLTLDGWKVLVTSGALETDAALTKAEFLAWFDMGHTPDCEQLRLIIEGYNINNFDPTDEYGVGWTEVTDYEEYNNTVIRKITDYVGGLGSLPAELADNIGKYFAAAGGYTTDKNLATDFKGQDGTNATAQIPEWTAQSYTEKSLVTKDFCIYRVKDGFTAASTDVPEISDKWQQITNANGKILANDLRAVSGDTVFKVTDVFDKTLFDTVGVPASPNLFNPANKYDNILVSTGANVGITGQSAGWNIAVIELPTIEPYTISGWNSTRNEIAFFSNTLPSPFPTIPPSPYATGLISSGSSSTVLGVTKSGGKMTFTPPAGTKWMVVNIANASEADSVFASFQIEKGSISTPYQPYNPTDTTTKVLKENFKPKTKIKEVKKVGDLVYVRTFMNSNYDLVRTINLHGSNSGGSNLTSSILIGKNELIISTGTVIHSMNDSVPPPFQVNTKDVGYSNIGGNHGVPVLDATATAHGKTSADRGSVWTDGTGWDWYIQDVLDANKLRIVGKPKDVGGFDRIKLQPASPLVHVSGATNTANISFTGSAYEYKPSINSISSKLYIDGKEIVDDGTYIGDVVKVIDTHNVVDPTQPNITAPFLPQNNGTMVKNTIETTFHYNNAITVDNPADWQKNTSVNNQGGIQPQCLTIGSYSDLKVYSMNVNTIGTTDFKNGFSIVSTPPTVIVTASNFIESTKAIQQMSQVLFNAGSPVIGAGFGYNPLVGLGKPSELLQNSSIFEFRNTKKYYPTGYTRASGTNILRVLGYFAYWDASINPKLSADYFIPDGKQDLYFLNIRVALTKEKIFLHNDLRNREFEIVNSSANITIHTLDISTSEGLIISGGVGDWCILKFK